MFKFILIILFSLVTNLSLAEDISTAIKVVKIIVPRAIVYADENMATPLGYISNGKLITVGNPRKLNPDLVPTLVSGRIAYIEIKDFEYQDEKLNQNSSSNYLKEHNIDTVLKSQSDKLNENNTFSFQVGRYYGGQDFANLVKNLEDKNASWITYTTLNFSHRPPTSKFFWGGDFQYHFFNEEGLHFKSFIFSPSMGYVLIRNLAFSIEAFFNLDIGSSTYLTIDNNYSDDPQGFMLGPQYGVRVVLSPKTSYKLFGSLSYRNYKCYSLKNIKRISPTDSTAEIDVPNLENISGVDLGAGLTFEF